MKILLKIDFSFKRQLLILAPRLLKNELGKIDKVRLLDRGAQQCSIVTFSINGTKEETRQFYHDHDINIYTTSRSSAVIDFQNKGID